MAKVYVKDGVLYTETPLATEPKLSSTGKSKLLAYETTKLQYEGREIKVQVNAYEKA